MLTKEGKKVVMSFLQKLSVDFIIKHTKQQSLVTHTDINYINHTLEAIQPLSIANPRLYNQLMERFENQVMKSTRTQKNQ